MSGKCIGALPQFDEEQKERINEWHHDFLQIKIMNRDALLEEEYFSIVSSEKKHNTES